MAKTRQRRVSVNHHIYRENEDPDHVYTEEDYAIREQEEPYADEWAANGNTYIGPEWEDDSILPDESFLPDEEEYPGNDWYPVPPPADNGYTPLFNHGSAYMEDVEPLSDEELLTDEERAELRRSNWKLLAGLMDFAGVILGTVAILALVTLLVSLLNWLINDVNQSFILLQKHL